MKKLIILIYLSIITLYSCEDVKYDKVYVEITSEKGIKDTLYISENYMLTSGNNTFYENNILLELPSSNSNYRAIAKDVVIVKEIKSYEK